MKISVIPGKVLIYFDELGTFTKGMFLYKTLDSSGEISPEFSTISVTNEVSIPELNSLIALAIEYTEGIEGISSSSSSSSSSSLSSSSSSSSSLSSSSSSSSSLSSSSSSSSSLSTS